MFLYINIVVQWISENFHLAKLHLYAQEVLVFHELISGKIICEWKKLIAYLSFISILSEEIFHFSEVKSLQMFLTLVIGGNYPPSWKQPTLTPFLSEFSESFAHKLSHVWLVSSVTRSLLAAFFGQQHPKKKKQTNKKPPPLFFFLLRKCLILRTSSSCAFNFTNL